MKTQQATVQVPGKAGHPTTLADGSGSSDGVLLDAAAVIGPEGEDAEVTDSQESERGRGGAFAPMHEAEEAEPSSYLSDNK